jgi:hypothetical protein
MKKRKGASKVELKYDEVIDVMLQTVPEIQVLYDEEIYGKGLPHIAYGSVLANFIRSVIAANPNGSRLEVTQRCFQLIERLASSSDWGVRNIIEVSVLESLLGQTKCDWSSFASHFGPNTNKMALELVERWNLDTSSNSPTQTTKNGRADSQGK